MEWRVIPGFDDYEISEYGIVRRLTRGGRRYPVGYELKPKKHKRGYLCQSLGDKTMLTHRMVALAFLGKPPNDNHEVAHNDGSRTNNHYTNLRWASPWENQNDRKKHGTYMAGEQCHWTVKLTDEQVLAIRAAYMGKKRYHRGGITMQSIADSYGMSIAQICRVINGKQRK